MGMFIKLNTMLTVSSFFESIQKLMDSTGEEVNVVYEATGVYTARFRDFYIKIISASMKFALLNLRKVKGSYSLQENG